MSNTVNNKVAKDTTLQSLITAYGLLAKDATLSTVAANLGNLVTAVNNQSGSGQSSGGATISDSQITITAGSPVVTGGTITANHCDLSVTGGGPVNVTNSSVVVDGVPAILSADLYGAIDNTIFETTAIAAEIHNGIYRGNNLGTAPTAAQLNAISTGQFKGLYIGDYWERSITYNNAAGASIIDTVIMRIAHIYYSQRCTTPNIMVIPEYSLYDAKMNDSNVNTGGYKGSKMFTTYLAPAIEAFKTFFGEENLLPYDIDLNTSATAFVTVSERIVDLLNHYQVFGTAGSYGVASDPEKTQLAIFKLNEEMRKAKTKSVGSFTYWWLRDPYSSCYFAGVNSSGASNSNGASSSYGVRPAALIG